MTVHELINRLEAVDGSSEVVGVVMRMKGSDYFEIDDIVEQYTHDGDGNLDKPTGETIIYINVW